MWQKKLNFDNFRSASFPVLAGAIAFVAMTCTTYSAAQQPGQRTFSSAEEASDALVAATRSNDEKALLDILGPDGKQIVSSGDETEDAENRANFLEKYQEMHRLVKEPDGSTTLYIGAENWPTSIPLMNQGSSWYFDTESGRKEILYRRIGRNEISTIRVCQELAAAQKEYYSTHQNQYARKILSGEGQQDGLYWKAPDGGSPSPVGPLVASAAATDYAKSQEQGSTPFRGYYFRLLTRQGKNGPGGAKEYVVDGKMTQGFAFVAYPAEYRSSGVMTFVVDQDGIVYQKDLGKKTAAVAKDMKAYNPDSTWQKNEDQQEEAVEGETTKH
jgi:hypothetical protein